MTDTASLGTAEDEAPGDGAFVEPAAMEDDLGELFPGDRGVLDPAVRRVLVHLLQRRFVLADRNREEWTALLDNQQLVESRLNDLFVRLVIDHDRGVAYKQQVRSDELDVPILLRDAAYTRSETLVLVHLRTVYQRESAAGEPAARVDIEDVEQTVMSYFADADGDTAKRQRLIRKAMDRLARDGIVDEETTGRFRISPLVEIVLSAEKLRELRDWLRDRSDADDTGGVADDESEDEEGDDEPQEVEL
ncbi:DUF4194 domain-containing protein [Microbacterium sp. H37-C3]|uniref:DUF4194 domain-containing protein n=1 Tax=Microbacterium sp. H37-C3 TaxID=3004354 RepID=UPI0022AF0EB1|nr:DUF4194 domain-containing protein [Microbacterium sp. H37-C3]MCZ4068811.1 DUF4194 domain-containing protein [Microbacterium sp. H37-C3]